MRCRLVLALLFLVLPIQFVWAAAAPYCAHEAETPSADASHFGHHEHCHPLCAETVAEADESGDAMGSYHADCATCHVGTSATLPAFANELPVATGDAVLGYRLPRYQSPTPSGPERPKIAQLTPAARFGGGAVSGSIS